MPCRSNGWESCHYCIVGCGYEFTWGTGKLYFEAMKVRNIRMHNRPAYNSEVHARRDMGAGELNNCCEDAQLADTVFVVGATPLEAQTNYFLNHLIPNLRGTSMGFKRDKLPDEEHAPARIIFVDPRRTVSVNACEMEAGPENVLRLAVKPGTDMVLMNALLTHIADQGWVDQAFIDAHTALLRRPGCARAADHPVPEPVFWASHRNSKLQGSGCNNVKRCIQNPSKTSHYLIKT